MHPTDMTWYLYVSVNMLTSPEFPIHSPLEVGSELDFSLKSGPVAASDGMHRTLTQVVSREKTEAGAQRGILGGRKKRGLWK